MAAESSGGQITDSAPPRKTRGGKSRDRAHTHCRSTCPHPPVMQCAERCSQLGGGPIFGPQPLVQCSNRCVNRDRGHAGLHRCGGPCRFLQPVVAEDVGAGVSKFLDDSSDDDESSGGKPTVSPRKHVRFEPMTSQSEADEQSVGSDACSDASGEESSGESSDGLVADSRRRQSKLYDFNSFGMAFLRMIACSPACPAPHARLQKQQEDRESKDRAHDKRVRFSEESPEIIDCLLYTSPSPRDRG